MEQTRQKPTDKKHTTKSLPGETMLPQPSAIPGLILVCATTAHRRHTARGLAFLCGCGRQEEVEHALAQLERERFLLKEHDQHGEGWRWLDSVESRRQAQLVSQENCDTPFLEYCLRLREGRALEAAEGLIHWAESLQHPRHAWAFDMILSEIIHTLIQAPVREYGDKERTLYIELCVRTHSMTEFQDKSSRLRVLLLRARAVARMVDNAGYFSTLDTILCVRKILMENRHASDMDAPLSFLDTQAGRENPLLANAFPYVGMFNYFKGNAREALDHFLLGEKTLREEKSPDAENSVLHGAFSTSFAALAAALFGDWALGISMLNASLRGNARGAGCPTRSWLHTHLATVLLAAGRPDEALESVESALAVSIGQNVQSWVAAHIALAHYHIAVGRPQTAHKILENTIAKAKEHEYRWGYSSPWFLDMLHVFHRQGFAPLEGYTLENEVEFCLAGKNPMLQAVAGRVRGDLLFRQGAPLREALLPLLRSRAFFKIQQLPVEKCKTCAIIAQVYLHHSDKGKALHYAMEAWPGYEQFHRLGIFWGSELMALMPQPRSATTHGRESAPEPLLRLFVKSLLELNPQDKDFFAQDLLKCIAQALGASRACLFDTDASGKAHLLRGLNIGHEHVYGKENHFPLYLVAESLEDVPVYMTREALNLPAHTEIPWHICCIPISTGLGRSHALYLDGDDFHRPEEIDDAFLLSCGEYLSVPLGRWLASTARVSQVNLSMPGGESGSRPLIYQSEAMRQVLDMVDSAGRSNASVLIYGESGVGKELVARRIHEHSGRSGAFVALNLSSLPEELFESEMLGYERGAFTGAQQRKAGMLELANMGTLFIDEVPDISPRIQLKLLRLLQERNFIRLGGTRVVSSDFRLIVATNRNLFEEMRLGSFRNDLFYRICVVPLFIPPLRERKDDIDALIRHYLEAFSRTHGKALIMPSNEQWRKLRDYPWPGNIRELKNVLERAVIFAKNDILAVSFDTEGFGNVMPIAMASQTDPWQSPLPSQNSPSLQRSPNQTEELLSIREMEKLHILRVLQATGGKVAGKDGAAAILGLSRSTLYEKMRALGISPANADLTP